MATATVEQHGDLRVIKVSGRPGGPAVVLFHGYGADAQDLAPLSQHLRLSDQVTWYFPEGPLTVPIAPGFEGRAWFTIDLNAYERAMATGDLKSLTLRQPSGMEGARQKVSKFLKALKSQHSKLIWGGFSQGAMLSMDVALASDVKPDALVLLSGTLVDRNRWEKLMVERGPIPYFQSHGRHDGVLAFEAAEELHELLSRAGWPGEFHEFNGGHEIPPQILERLSRVLKEQVGA